MDRNKLYRSIPKVDLLLENSEIKDLVLKYGRENVLYVIRKQIEALRTFLDICDSEEAAKDRMEGLVSAIAEGARSMSRPSMKPVINATGTILHTNLGRAPMSEEHADRLRQLLVSYSNLEYDLKEGKRGERYSHFENLLCRITGAQAAMAVNNNAAAVMLILRSLAYGGEVIVSRGELVEIGGKFRIPSVIEQSGCTLVEVGTTNKTHLSDYENAISENTKAFLKVHTSNYSILGFAESVDIEELKPISQKTGIPIIEDLGSGTLIDLSKYGLSYEPTVQRSIQNGADVVCFSGDKLLGGPQAGIIVGKKKYIDLIKKNQLTRALRIGKFSAAALEMVLLEYLDENSAIKNIPAMKMMCESCENTALRAEKLKNMLQGIQANVSLEVCESQLGGGSLPLERIKSVAVAVRPFNMSASELERQMRYLEVPIISRIFNDTVYLDIRTIDSSYFEIIAKELKRLIV